MEKPYLVEIRLKDWMPDINSLHGKRVVTYVEVLATEEYYARHAGFAEFEKRCKYEPVMKRRMEMYNLLPSDCCAPDALELDS